MALYFHNPGEIDIRGAVIAGLSAKDNDSAIGFFGTGLKYSIACVLRWGGSITIYSGITRHSFAAEPLSFRGKEFSQITMSTGQAHFPRDLGEPQALGFTTEYGKKWEAWQVFRELYANARDEGGDVSLREVGARPGSTVIIVDCPQLQAMYDQRDKIILPRNWTPTESVNAGSRQCDVLAQQADHIYYRDVRVYGQFSRLTYNFRKGIDLTEDRTLADSWILGDFISNVIGKMTNEAMITMALEAGDPFVEGKCRWAAYEDVSEEFLNVAARLYRNNPMRHGRLKDILERKRPDAVEEQIVTLTVVQQRMLDRAFDLVQRIEPNWDWDRSIVKVCELGKDTLGLYKNGQIRISPLVFKQGTKQLVSTLYEEFLHRHSGMQDRTYEMQTWLFNRIIDLAEEHIFGEPC